MKMEVGFMGSSGDLCQGIDQRCELRGCVTGWQAYVNHLVTSWSCECVLDRIQICSRVREMGQYWEIYYGLWSDLPSRTFEGVVLLMYIVLVTWHIWVSEILWDMHII
ncbi:hypothetical protein Scep_010525 [Stephania cephalantha]|uniref:Uncharacterized protein n=1 Tax=Stephania cephalantha TaxID=152367 RepID=A0AAP0PFB3_9MAGN